MKKVLLITFHPGIGEHTNTLVNYTERLFDTALYTLYSIRENYQLNTIEVSLMRGNCDLTDFIIKPTHSQEELDDLIIDFNIAVTKHDMVVYNGGERTIESFLHLLQTTNVGVLADSLTFESNAITEIKSGTQYHNVEDFIKDATGLNDVALKLEYYTKYITFPSIIVGAVSNIEDVRFETAFLFIQDLDGIDREYNKVIDINSDFKGFHYIIKDVATELKTVYNHERIIGIEVVYDLEFVKAFRELVKHNNRHKIVLVVKPDDNYTKLTVIDFISENLDYIAYLEIAITPDKEDEEFTKTVLDIGYVILNNTVDEKQ